MTPNPILNLSKHEHIITAYAERHQGPGWTNELIWVVVRNTLDGTMREECIQPDERTPAMHWLFDVAASAHTSLMEALSCAVRGDT